jgi:hypothetical protein
MRKAADGKSDPIAGILTEDECLAFLDSYEQSATGIGVACNEETERM